MSPDLKDIDRDAKVAVARGDSTESTTGDSSAQGWDAWKVLGPAERARTTTGLTHALAQGVALDENIKAWPSSSSAPVISIKKNHPQVGQV